MIKNIKHKRRLAIAFSLIIIGALPFVILGIYYFIITHTIYQCALAVFGIVFAIGLILALKEYDDYDEFQY